MRQRVLTLGVILLSSGLVALGQDVFVWGGENEALKQRMALSFALQGGPKGRWWKSPQMSERLGLTADQQKKMDDIFQQNRIKLIDLNAGLEKEEAILEPLMSAEQPDDAKTMAQIERVAQARAELEKVNGKMLWSIRRVLTPEQWKQVQTGFKKPIRGSGFDPKPVPFAAPVGREFF